MYYQTAHWQSKGVLFYQDHLLFERLYNSVNEEIDTVAEKGVALTADISVVNLCEHLKSVYALAEKLPTENAENVQFAQTALMLEKQFLSFLAEVEQQGSVGFKNLCGDLADKHEQNIYLLGQRTLK